MRLLQKFRGRVLSQNTEGVYVLEVDQITKRYISLFKVDNLLVISYTIKSNKTIFNPRLFNGFFMYQEDYHEGNPLPFIAYNISNGVEVMTLIPIFYLENVESKSKLFVSLYNQKSISFFDENLFLIETPLIDQGYQYEFSNFVFRNYENTIWCYSLETGKKLWQANTTDLQFERPIKYNEWYAATDNPKQCFFVDDLMIAIYETHQACFELETGRVVWEAAFHSVVPSYSFFDNEMVYIISGGHFIVLDARTGNKIKENTNFDALNKFIFQKGNRFGNYVFNENNVYTCSDHLEVFTFDKNTLDLVNVEKVIEEKEVRLGDKLYLQNNNLFVTLEYQKPERYTEILVFDVV